MKRGWIVQRAPRMEEGRPFAVEESHGLLRVKIGEEYIALEVGSSHEGQGWCRWNGRQLPFEVAGDETHVHLWLAGETFIFELLDGPPRRGQASGAASEGSVAQVPGKVASVLVAEGERIEAGQRLVIIESMKMEFVVRASASGVVRRILVEPGAQVMAGTQVVEIDAGE